MANAGIETRPEGRVIGLRAWQQTAAGSVAWDVNRIHVWFGLVLLLALFIVGFEDSLGRWATGPRHLGSDLVDYGTWETEAKEGWPIEKIFSRGRVKGYILVRLQLPEWRGEVIMRVSDVRTLKTMDLAQVSPPELYSEKQKYVCGMY